MGRVRPAVNTSTGEYVQLELLGADEDKEPYDWSGGGRHVNASKVNGAALWAKDSGYTKNDKLVYGHYLFNAPVGDQPLRQSFREIAAELELRANAVGKSVGNLHRGGYLVLAETVGRVVFYKLNARAAFDGSSLRQRRAAEKVPRPVVPCPPEMNEEAAS